MKKQLDNIITQGGHVLGTIGKTIGNMGEKMIELFEKVLRETKEVGFWGLLVIL